MRIAVNLDTNGPIEATIERASRLAERGFTNFWSSQIFGPDTLTVLALVGHELRELNLGTAVVPIQTRHPTMLAAQARTVQDAIGARLSLGVGLSHQMVVEGMWGISFERPASYMHEYLNALAPMLRGEAVKGRGRTRNGGHGWPARTQGRRHTKPARRGARHPNAHAGGHPRRRDAALDDRAQHHRVPRGPDDPHCRSERTGANRASSARCPLP